MCTLQQFLTIVGHTVIQTRICDVYEEYEDKDFGLLTRRIEFNGNIESLTPYLDYEVYGFDQEYCWGEIDRQLLWIRKPINNQVIIKKWMDVKDRLPEDCNEKLVTVDYGDGSKRFVAVAWYDHYEPEWSSYNGFIVAWMDIDIPEVYKGGD